MKTHYKMPAEKSPCGYYILCCAFQYGDKKTSDKNKVSCRECLKRMRACTPPSYYPRKGKKMTKTIPCMFVTVWDDDITLRSKAVYHEKTGEIDVLEVIDVEGLESLTRQYIVIYESTDQEEEIDVCPVCQEYVMRGVMVPGMGHDLNEDEECANPDCDSHGGY